MTVTLFLITLVALIMQPPFAKIYNQKTGNKCAYLYSALLSFFAMLFFVVSGLLSGGLHFTTEFIIYSVFFALAYGTASVSNLTALRHGSMAITTLIVNLSLMIPTLYGIIFLGEPTSVWLYLGIAFLVIALFLVNYQKSQNTNKVTFIWVILTILAAVGNGMCSTVQKVEQVAMNGQYKNEFMIVALLIVTFIFLIFSFSTERKDIKPTLKKGIYFPIIVGALNGTVNLLVMVLGNMMPVSLLFPLLTSGGIIGNYFLSRFYFKEKLSTVQTMGLIAGIIAVVFFNI
ncbi:MAG: hypothetical protein Q4B31_00970 [Clostridia bacterium]|nr:hypothetical protein [Clostridia bacterium]